VKSVYYSDLYRLDRELFEEVLKRYPQIAGHIKKIAEERMKMNQSPIEDN
jgi:CRP-like cAMP-binding protein